MYCAFGPFIRIAITEDLQKLSNSLNSTLKALTHFVISSCGYRNKILIASKPKSFRLFTELFHVKLFISFHITLNKSFRRSLPKLEYIISLHLFLYSFTFRTFAFINICK